MAREANSTKETAIRELMDLCEDRRTELLQLVLQQDTVVPNACKQVFWKTSKVVHTFYQGEGVDPTTSKEILRHADSLLHEPISLD